MRTLQAQSDEEAAQRHKELLELVVRACSIPALGKTFSTDTKSVDLDSAHSGPLPQTSSASLTKLYLTQECPVCLEDVQDVTEWRAFRCGHGICYACLCKAVSLVTTLADVKCPICREHVVGGAGAEELEVVEEASVEDPSAGEGGPPEAAVPPEDYHATQADSSPSVVQQQGTCGRH